MPRISVVAVGNELLNGAIADSNTHFLVGELHRLGVEVVGGMLVPDKMISIVESLKFAVAASDVVLVSGGLGPTSDDITRDAIAEFLNVSLEVNKDSLARIAEKAKVKNRPMTPNEERQSYFPCDATVISNPVGSADSFRCTYKKSSGESVSIISLPGVPRELKEIYRSILKPWLLAQYPELEEPPFVYLKCFGLPESYLGSLIDPLQLDTAIHVSYRPMFPLILLSLTLQSAGDVELLNDAAAKIRKAVGEQFIISNDPAVSMSDCVGSLLRERNLKIACAESCSGGKIADLVVSAPGSSAYFLSSVVSYDNSIKEKLLSVDAGDIAKHGAVSPEVALQMAKGVKELSGADIAVSTTGVAGPDGGTESKPVGTVYFGYVSKTRTEVVKKVYPAERNAFRTYCATFALDLVRRDLLGLDFPK